MYLTRLTLKSCALIDFSGLGEVIFPNLMMLFVEERNTTIMLNTPALMNFGDGDIFENGDVLPKLRYLTLYDIYSLIGNKQWSPKHYQNLKNLDIKRCIKLKDAFFQNGVFQGLESLKLRNIPLITGSLWGFSVGSTGFSQKVKISKVWSNLTTLQIMDCIEVKDALFQTFFPKLEKLELGRLPLLTGNNWNNMPNLVSVYMFGLMKFTGFFFRTKDGKKFPKLVRLELSNMDYRMSRKGWNLYLWPSLKGYYVNTGKVPRSFWKKMGHDAWDTDLNLPQSLRD